jgi:hypothetical protein
MRPGDRTFSGACRLTDIHDAIRTEAVTATWVSEFIAADRLDRRFIEVLLWVFQSVGMCFAVVDEYTTYMADVISNWNDVTIHVAYPSRKNPIFRLPSFARWVPTARPIFDLRVSFLLHFRTYIHPLPVSHAQRAQG